MFCFRSNFFLTKSQNSKSRSDTEKKRFFHDYAREIDSEKLLAHQHSQQMIFIHSFFFYKSEARHEKAQSQKHNLPIDNFPIHAFPYRSIVSNVGGSDYCEQRANIIKVKASRKLFAQLRWSFIQELFSNFLNFHSFHENFLGQFLCFASNHRAVNRGEIKTLVI